MITYVHWPEARVLRRVRLGPSHIARRESFQKYAQPSGIPCELVIARHDSQSRRTINEPAQPYANYYLFYLGENGEELNDFCEPTLAEIVLGAETTFGIAPEEWEIISEDTV